MFTRKISEPQSIDGSSIIAPKLKLETEDDRARFNDAKERLAFRIEQRRIEATHHHH